MGHLARTQPPLPPLPPLLRCRCIGTPQLAEKYGVAEDNRQTVVSVTNRVTLAQVRGAGAAAGCSGWAQRARALRPVRPALQPSVRCDPHTTAGG